jgi:hypothetical protein
MVGKNVLLFGGRGGVPPTNHGTVAATVGSVRQ